MIHPKDLNAFTEFLTELAALEQAGSPEEAFYGSKPLETNQDQPKKKRMGKYQREIKGVVVDVYDVLGAFNVTCPARQHAIKKLLATGQRGHKDEETDLIETISAVKRSLELATGKTIY